METLSTETRVPDREPSSDEGESKLPEVAGGVLGLIFVYVGYRWLERKFLKK